MENIGQIIGLIAALIAFYSFTLKDDNKLILFQIGVNFLLVIHFYLIGFNATAIVTFFIALRVIFAYRFNNNYTYFIFLLIPIAQGINMYMNDIQFFEYGGLLSSFIVTHVYFKLRQVPMRIGFVIGCFFWCITAFYTNSYSVFLVNFVGLIIHSYTGFRIYFDNKNIVKSQELC